MSYVFSGAENDFGIAFLLQTSLLSVFFIFWRYFLSNLILLNLGFFWPYFGLIFPKPISILALFWFYFVLSLVLFCCPTYFCLIRTDVGLMLVLI